MIEDDRIVMLRLHPIRKFKVMIYLMISDVVHTYMSRMLKIVVKDFLKLDTERNANEVMGLRLQDLLEKTKSRLGQERNRKNYVQYHFTRKLTWNSVVHTRLLTFERFQNNSYWSSPFATEVMRYPTSTCLADITSWWGVINVISVNVMCSQALSSEMYWLKWDAIANKEGSKIKLK